MKRVISDVFWNARFIKRSATQETSHSKEVPDNMFEITKHLEAKDVDTAREMTESKKLLKISNEMYKIHRQTRKNEHISLRQD